MATVSASSTAAANGPRPPNAELPTPPNAPRGSRASFATLKRPCSPANPCLSFALLVTFCSAPVVYFYSALDRGTLYFRKSQHPVVHGEVPSANTAPSEASTLPRVRYCPVVSPGEALFVRYRLLRRICHFQRRPQTMYLGSQHSSRR